VIRVAQSASLILMVCLAMPGQADEWRGKAPFEIVRELQLEQDRAVLQSQGDPEKERERIAGIGGRLGGFAEQVWSEPRNARAVVLYVLSGGTPATLRKLIDAKVKLGIDETLAKAALAYGERQDDKAISLFNEVDVAKVDPSILGHIALVRALLVVEKDAPLAITYFDTARVSATGTIVEEAALRRQAILYSKIGDLDSFETLSSQYFRRFARSRYGQSFGHQFANVAVTGGYAGEQRMSKLTKLLDGLDKEVRREICLLIAEEGIAAANVHMVRFGTGMAEGLVEKDSRDATRLQLYEAAAVVATEDAEKGRDMLKGIKRSKLSARDQGLLDAALHVAGEVMRAPPPAPQHEEKVQDGASGEARDEVKSAALSRAEAAIAQTDKLLSETAR
jgi:chemotaxis protein MotC